MAHPALALAILAVAVSAPPPSKPVTGQIPASAQPKVTVTVKGPGEVRMDVVNRCTSVRGQPEVACGFGYLPGSWVSLTAMTAPDSDFTGWAGPCSGQKTTCQLKPSGNVAVTASFIKRVEVRLQFAGQGEATGDLFGCASLASGAGAGVCKTTLSPGATTTFKAKAKSGFVFAGSAEGAKCTADGTCTVTAGSQDPLIVTVRFRPAS